MASPLMTLARRTAALALVIAAGLALAGCVDAAPEPTGTPTDFPTSAPTVLPTDTATEQQGALDVACTDLVSADAIYAFDPNFALVGTFDPDPGSAAALALDNEGVVCRWMRETGGITIDLAVARLGDAEITRLTSEAAASSELVSTYGESAYFDAATGTATVFQGSDWLVITSPAFAEPGEPAQIIDSALAVLAAIP